MSSTTYHTPKIVESQDILRDGPSLPSSLLILSVLILTFVLDHFAFTLLEWMDSNLGMYPITVPLSCQVDPQTRDGSDSWAINIVCPYKKRGWSELQ